MGFGVCVGTSSLVSMELRWVRKTSKKCDDNVASSVTSPRSIPVYISTLKKDVNFEELRSLYSCCDSSCNRLLENGSSSVVDMKKLRTAISRSDVVVSVFCKACHADDSVEEEMVRNVLHLSPLNGRLVGFGRAYSDHSLTAAIHDLMVLPSLQRMGIGKLIVNRIIRHLTSRDIYDISALCIEDERPFFKACGFGEDKMGSTTMMFTKSLEAEKGIGSS